MGGTYQGYQEGVRKKSGKDQERVRNKSGTSQEEVRNRSGTGQMSIRCGSATFGIEFIHVACVPRFNSSHYNLQKLIEIRT